jgi:hypothetical protein
MLIDSILPKWNPTVSNHDLCDKLALTDEELQYNEQPIQTDEIMVFDPNYTLTNISSGFRIFAAKESLSAIPARRYDIIGPDPKIMTVFLHAQIIRPG